MSAVSVLTYAALAVILTIGGRSVIAGTLTAGELTAFLIYTGMVASAFGTVASLYGSLSRAAGATERLYDVVDQIPTKRVHYRLRIPTPKKDLLSLSIQGIYRLRLSTEVRPFRLTDTFSSFLKARLRRTQILRLN